MTNEPTGQRLRVATYNVHGCVGMDGQRSESRIAEVIASMSADIVGLQELDLGRPRSSHADQAALIATRLGWKYHFHPAMRSGEEQYGNAIVSRFPIELKRADEMPGTPPWSLPRAADRDLDTSGNRSRSGAHYQQSFWSRPHRAQVTGEIPHWTDLARLCSTRRTRNFTR